MIESVVWAQYINVTDRHTDSHVAIANAAPTDCVGRQKRRYGKSEESATMHKYRVVVIIIIIITKFLQRHKVVTSEALGSVSQLCVLVKR